jgi:peptidoglycan LD-endopeptidase CwlK
MPGNIVTNAGPGYSMHNFGLAIDVVPYIDGVVDWNSGDARWQEILTKAPSCGLGEGALWSSFPDKPHLYPNELQAEPTKEMRAAMASGGLQAVWALIQPQPADLSLQGDV